MSIKYNKDSIYILPKITNQYLKGCDQNFLFGDDGMIFESDLDTISTFLTSVLSAISRTNSGEHIVYPYILNGFTISAIHFVLLDSMNKLRIPFENTRCHLLKRTQNAYYPMEEIIKSITVLSRVFMELKILNWDSWRCKRILTKHRRSSMGMRDQLNHIALSLMHIPTTSNFVFPKVVMNLQSHDYDGVKKTINQSEEKYYKDAYRLFDYDMIAAMDAFIMNLVTTIYSSKIKPVSKNKEPDYFMVRMLQNNSRELKIVDPFKKRSVLGGNRSFAGKLKEEVFKLPWIEYPRDYFGSGMDKDFIEEDSKTWDQFYDNIEKGVWFRV